MHYTKRWLTMLMQLNHTTLKNKNRGFGAGGSNTNLNGKKFEDKTNNEFRLLKDEYIFRWTMFNGISKKTKKTYDYLYKEFEDKTIVFASQQKFKKYIKYKYNIDFWRCPDEAYIIEYKTGRKVIKIVEKKEQNVVGSVETKLWASSILKREYELEFNKSAQFEICYCLCVNNFLKTKLTSTETKYETLMQILTENNITVLFGDDTNYFETFDIWFNETI